jgi:hypothetical protein
MEFSEIKNVNDIITYVTEQAGVDLPALPVLKSCAWFSGKVFKVKELVPLGGLETLTVQAMFQDESEVRIYAVQLIDPENPPAKEAQLPNHRVTLSKTAATIGIEVCELACYCTLLADEFRALSSDVNEGQEAIDLLDAMQEALEEGDIELVVKLLKGEDDDEEDAKANGEKKAPEATA